MAPKIQKTILVAVLAALGLTACGGAEERKAKYFERSKAYVAEQNWDKARIEIKNVLQIDPKSADAYALLGEIELHSQELRKAFGNYLKAVELDPEQVQAREQLAKIYLLQANAAKSTKDYVAEAKSLAQAQTEIDEILKRDPKHPGARSLQASMLMREGKNDEAIALTEGILKESPGHGPSAALLATLYAQAGRDAEAEKILLTTIPVAEDSKPLKLRLVEIYVQDKKNDKAEAILRELVTENPDQLDYRVKLAQFLSMTDRADKAEVVLREAIAADPEDARRYLMLADLMVAKKDLASAIAYMKEQVVAKPEIYELRLGLARLYEQNKDFESAKGVYKEIVKRFGEEAPGLTARNRLALQAITDNELEQAKKYVQEVLAVNARDSEALLLKGRLALLEKDFDTAIVSFRTVIKDQPESVPLLHLLAEAQMRKGDMDLAGDNLRRAVEIAPQNADARVKYARYLIMKKELTNALEQIDRVLAQTPDDANALAAKSEVLAAKGDLKALKAELTKLKELNPENTEYALRLARVYMAENDSAKALAEIDAVLTRDAKSIPALILKTDILATTQDIENLETTIRRLKEVAPENAEGYFRMGRLLRAQKDVVGALKEYEQGYSLAQGAGKSAMLHEIVNTHLMAKQADEALARVQAVLREEPEHKTANELLGRVQMAREDYAAAEVAFENQLKIDPNNAATYAQLSLAREMQDNMPGAVNAYEKGLDTLKDDATLMIGLAGLHERKGDVDASMALYEKILEKLPDNAVAVNNLAALLVDHRTDEQSLERAKQLAGKLEAVKRPDIQDTVGWVYYRTGDYAKAIDTLNEVVNAAPKVALFQYHLGMAHAKAGDKVKAKTHLTAALELGDFQGAEEARSVLKDL